LNPQFHDRASDRVVAYEKLSSHKLSVGAGYQFCGSNPSKTLISGR
jgi:hypothetical protein